MTQKQLLFVNQSNYCVYIWHWWMHQSTQNHIRQRPIKHNGRGSLKLQCDCVRLANKFDWNWDASQCEILWIKWMQFVLLLLMGVVYWCNKSIGIQCKWPFSTVSFYAMPDLHFTLEFYSRLNTVVLQSHCLLFHPIQLLHRAEPSTAIYTICAHTAHRCAQSLFQFPVLKHCNLITIIIINHAYSEYYSHNKFNCH